jgi:Skp family chaperone for outer membrane proteins
MKKLILVALLVSGMATAPAFADEKEEHYKEGTKGVSPEVIRPEYLDQMKIHNVQMEAHLKDMQKLMDKMHATKDAKERRKLMNEHAKSMRELMKSMRSTSNEMKMGMMAGGPKGGGPMAEGEKLRQHLLEKRIDMMNMMMEQTMQSEDMMKSMH